MTDKAVAGGLRVAVLIKQIPRFQDMALGPDGRLDRSGVELDMNAYCRRAVAKGVELAHESGGSATIYTLGPPPAEDVLREAVAFGADRAVLVSDGAFAGSDSLATARALAAALELDGPYDLIMAGRNSVDADTGQVPPALAELLDLPLLCGVRELSLADGVAEARCEHDDGWLVASVALPAVLTVAERICFPARAEPEARAAVDAARIRTISAADLGSGPWGQAGSPTSVGEVRILESPRAQRRLDGSAAAQVSEAVALLEARGALNSDRAALAQAVPLSHGATGPAIGVVVEPGRPGLGRELSGAAARLAGDIDGHVVALTSAAADAGELGSWGADAVVRIEGATAEEDVARGLADWATEAQPWAILAPGTIWGREVAARAAARLDAGLTGDAVELEARDGRLIAWKPAFGGQLVAAIECSSPIQMATVRAGALALSEPRERVAAGVATVVVEPRGRVAIASRTRDDEIDALATADCVIGLGMGIPPEEHTALEPLRDLLGGEFAATRKVTDQGWLPRARQVGITGRSIAPRLYLAVGISGKFTHAVGLRQAGTVLAINNDPEALIFESADIGILGDWREVVPLLRDALAKITGGMTS